MYTLIPDGKHTDNNTCVLSAFIPTCFIKPRLHDTTGCQTGCQIGCIVYTNIQPVVKPGLTTG